ncbi:MAG: DUF3021 family protein [Treponema sp.]|nr:DUF3021 family protein [Treponema sp.]
MKNETLKEIILYVLASTGAVLFLLAAFAMFRENNFIYADTILQITGANIVITIGLFMTNKVELRYAILEFLLDIGFMTAVIVLAGTIFNWYSSIPVWVPLIIVFAVYILFYLLDIIRVRRDIKEINNLLQKIKEKETDMAS